MGTQWGTWCTGLLHLEEAHHCNAGADLSACPVHLVLGLELEAAAHEADRRP